MTGIINIFNRHIMEVSPEYAGKIAGKILRKQKSFSGELRKSDQIHRIWTKYFSSPRKGFDAGYVFNDAIKKATK